jgi:hypothetical protein
MNFVERIGCATHRSAQIRLQNPCGIRLDSLRHDFTRRIP